MNLPISKTANAVFRLTLIACFSIFFTFNLSAQDMDGDGIPDAEDNCPMVPNSTTRPITIDGDISDFGAPVGTNGFADYYFSADDTYFYLGVTGIDLGADNLFFVFQNGDGGTGVAQFGEDFSQNNWTYLVGFFSADDICYYPFDDPFGCQQQGGSWFNYAGFGGNTTSEIRIPRSFLGSYGSGSGTVKVGVWANNNASTFVFNTFPNTNPTGPTNQLWLEYAMLPYPTYLPQADSDMDMIGDACDNCPTVASSNQKDTDMDGLGNKCDNCRYVSNPGQEDIDMDGRGDVCDICPNDDMNDADGDGICGDVDNCPDEANGVQGDRDGDGVGNLCDNCPDTPNPDQMDSDGNGTGDACEGELGRRNFETEITLPTEFQLTPNPTSKNVQIQLEEFVGLSGTIRITNLQGQTIWIQDHQEFTGATLEISTASFATGIYQVIIQANGEVYTKNLVKN